MLFTDSVVSLVKYTKIRKNFADTKMLNMGKIMPLC